MPSPDRACARQGPVIGGPDDGCSPCKWHLRCSSSRRPPSFHRVCSAWLGSIRGFVADGVLTMQLAPPVRYATPEGRALFVERVLNRVEQLPGVARAGTTQTTWRPLASMQARLQIENGPPDLTDNLFTNIRHVTPGYFERTSRASSGGPALRRPGSDRSCTGGSREPGVR